jgi:hypothetical protein
MGLDRTERLLFLFGILGFGLLMLLFGEPFGEGGDLPVVILWIVSGIGFIWWLDRRIARDHDHR